MRRGTRIFLLAGCALVFLLEAPTTFAVLAEGWRGPYGGRVLAARPAGPARSGLRPMALVLARVPRAFAAGPEGPRGLRERRAVSPR